MSSQQYSWRYEIVLNIQGQTYNDVIYFVVYKIPMVYLSSFSRLCIMLPPAVIATLKDYIGKSQYPHVNIQIYTPDDLTGNRINVISDRNYQIVNIIGETNIETPKQHVILQLVNPILYKMATTFMFDKRIESKSGKELLDEYENFLKENYGDIFEHQKICDENKFLDYKYEETLVFEESDILIPINIINYRKPTSFYPTFFFDDFHFSSSNPGKIINTFLIDYSSNEFHDQAPPLSQFIESITNSKTDRIIPLGDHTKSLDKINDNLSRSFVDTENMVCYYKKKDKGKRYEFKEESEQVKITAEKHINNVESSIISKLDLQQSSYEMILNYNDSLENLTKRVNNCYKFFKNGPVNLHYVSTHYGLIDWIQFPYKYALDPDDKNDYRFVPFNIVNIFKRELKDTQSQRTDTDLHPVWCKYTCRATFLEYVNDEE